MKFMIIAAHTEKNELIVKHLLKPKDKLTKIGGRIMHIVESNVLNEKGEQVCPVFVICCEGNWLQFKWAKKEFANHCIMQGWPSDVK